MQNQASMPATRPAPALSGARSRSLCQPRRRLHHQLPSDELLDDLMRRADSSRLPPV